MANPNHSVARRKGLPDGPFHSAFFAGKRSDVFHASACEHRGDHDVNGDLINLYRVVPHHLEEFVRQFKWGLLSGGRFSG